MKCRKTTRLILLGLMLVGSVALPAFGQEAGDALTNDDVIKLTQAGVAPSVISAMIRSSATDFDTSVDGVLALAQAGVHEDVMEAMAGPAAPPPAPAGAHLPVPVQTLDLQQTVRYEPTRTQATPTELVRTDFSGTGCEGQVPGIYFDEEDEGKVVRPLEPTIIQQGQNKGGALGGITKALVGVGVKAGRSLAVLGNARAPVRTDRSPKFLFCLEESQAGMGAVNPMLFPFVELTVKPKKNQRTLVVGKDFGLAVAALSDEGLGAGAGSSERSGVEPKAMRQITYERLKPGVYSVSPGGGSLPPGEYGFYYPGDMDQIIGVGLVESVFAFGVD